jgi:chromosome segregation ATPase
MSTQPTPTLQRAGFFGQVFRRKDSTMPTPSASPTSSTAPSSASLAHDNDKLAQEIIRLKKRNEDLTEQSEVNQDLFQQTSEALAAKERELSELKEFIRRNDTASNQTIQTLGLQLEDLATQLEVTHEATAEREAMLAKLESQQEQLLDKIKTIEFLRRREGKAYKRIDKLNERVAVLEELGRDWEATIKLANSKAKTSEVKPPAGIQ